MAEEFTVGIEEEYQLVDSESGELQSRARDVLALDWGKEIQHEIHETMIEVGTRICSSADEVDQEVRRLRFQVASTAAAEGMRIVAAALHPFSRWQDQQDTKSERYDELRARYGRVIRTEHIFGMHVHVAVPAHLDRVKLMTTVRRYLPHLLALSASSPIYEREDTLYASYRAILAQRLPYTGAPPGLTSEAEYRKLLDRLFTAGAIEDEWTIYWNIRPHPEYPTLEFRITDVCPRAGDAIAIAQLIRALVVAAANGVLENGSDCNPVEDVILASNQWHAARFGLDAGFVNVGTGEGQEPARDSIRRLLDRVEAVAEDFGSNGDLRRGIETILERGNGADRIRTTADGCGDLTELVDWLAEESLVGTGLDRRMEQRKGCGPDQNSDPA